MTKDRARKQAARDRASRTGERYVVAQRAIAEREHHKARRMHELTHKMPGVPSHVDGGMQGSTSRGRNASQGLRHRPRHNEPRVHGEPRVLVAWQNWIARRLGVRSK